MRLLLILSLLIVNLSSFANATDQKTNILKSIFEAKICNTNTDKYCDRAEKLNYAPILVKTIKALTEDAYQVAVFFENGTIDKMMNFKDLKADILNSSTPTPNSFIITNTMANYVEGSLRLFKKINGGNFNEYANTYIFIKGFYNNIGEFIVTDFKVEFKGIS
jgi:hypothetical protein